VSSGLETLRLSSAGGSLASFINGALNLAERRQQPIEITIDTQNNLVLAQSAGPGFVRKLEMPDGVRILGVLPPLVAETGQPRRFVVYPGGTVPRFVVELSNRKGARRIVRIDPITGIPQLERPAAQ
jgi:hypothetical protein